MFILRDLSVTTPVLGTQSTVGLPSLPEHWGSQTCPSVAFHGLQVEKELDTGFLFLL